uniref:Receptor expression-enhancing protein n=1 Tax=Parastrongyloides trichosuri TaxID=131310 RepID=A0A0N4ZMD3_PARTI
MDGNLLQNNIHNTLKIQLSKDNEFNRVIGKLGRPFKLLRHEVVYVLLGLLSLYLLFGPGALLVSRIITIGLPIYYFLCIIKNREQFDVRRLLLYWPFYALFHIIDYYIIYIEQYIPCYVFLKTVFLIYLCSEWSKGSLRMYRAYIKPFIPDFHKSNGSSNTPKSTNN